MGNYIESTVKEIKERVGNKKVILGLSGGVVSSVAAALINKAIGKQLTCIFVDTGLLRKDEVKQVGRELEIPNYMVDRHPFPGPGLGIRILGIGFKRKSRYLKRS